MKRLITLLLCVSLVFTSMTAEAPEVKPKSIALAVLVIGCVVTAGYIVVKILTTNWIYGGMVRLDLQMSTDGMKTWKTIDTVYVLAADAKNVTWTYPTDQPKAMFRVQVTPQ